MFWSTIPGIESKAGRFRLLTLIVFVGGLGRLIGLLLTGLTITLKAESQHTLVGTPTSRIAQTLAR